MEQNTLDATRYQSNVFTTRHNATPSLKGYLKEVSALEVQLYNQMRLAAKLKVKANNLGQHINLTEPRKPSFSLYNLLHTKNLLCIIPIAFAFATVIVFLFAGIFWAALPIVAILTCIALIPDLLDYRSSMKSYQEDMKKYENATSADIRRVEHERLAKTEIWNQINCIKKELFKTKDVLNSLYALDIIHPSYRNLVAVCSFHDYLDKGICTQLTGHGGAYAFFEEELRFRRIETQLDIIIDKLDEIIVNQHQLASLIQEGNIAINKIMQQNNQMVSTLDGIRENTAVTAYNTHCAAQSASILESIEIYRTLKYN
ncbi:MAG: hypothetical protein E7293_04095 [Lachnospiraceae bacterium]|nr:hypothetical protein [Lachnospiraceae bacterium]